MSDTSCRQSPPETSAKLMEMLEGYRVTCVIASAVELGLIEALRDAPCDEEGLASALRAHLPSLRRFLRVLKVFGIVRDRENAIGLTSMGRLLLKDASGMRDRAVLVAEEYLPAWANLRHSVLTGKPAFDDVFGMNVWQQREANPRLGEAFNRVMAVDHAQTKSTVVDACELDDCNLVVDVGGGRGHLISQILAKHPQMRGVLFDQPSVVKEATSVLSEAGTLDRCRLVGGSFFDSVPKGGNAYLLQHVLHDWDDEDCLKILCTCRAAMDPFSTLLVIENILPEDHEPTARLVMVDLHMMVVLGGRERTLREYEALLKSAGLEPTKCITTRGNCNIIVAAPSRPSG